MATRTFDNGAGDGGKWSTAANWSDDTLPGDGDTAALSTYTVVMDISTIPAAGSLAGITASSGKLTVDMSATGLNGNATINCGTGDLQAGTSDLGLIYLSVASTNTLTINGNLKAGAGTSDICVYITTASNHCHLTVVGNVTAGGGTQAHGIFSNVSGYSGNITITGTVTGGVGAGACGISLPTAYAGTLTLNSCNLIDGTGGVAVYSPRAITWNVGTTNYITKGAQNWYYDIPGAANVRETDTVAGVTGEVLTKTLSAANETVAAGYYEATTLSAVDADLAAANIAVGTTIFGFVGAAAGGGGGLPVLGRSVVR